MKRYLVFAGTNYRSGFAGGGWDDFINSYDDANDAIAQISRDFPDKPPDWAHVIDTESGTVLRFPKERPE